jgi:hypothetical protein
MLEDLQPATAIRSCRVRTVRDELSKKDAELFMGYVNNESGWTHHGLAKALAARNVNIDPKAIQRHRLNQCTCRLLEDVG